MTRTVMIAAGTTEISAVLDTAATDPIALLILAHGAGARRDHPSMDRLAAALNGVGFSVLRFNFPYSEAKRRVPDRAPVLVRTWLDAFAWARSHAPGRKLPVLAGGRSMGGRMASMAAAEHPDVFTPVGLVFFAYPLHPPGRPERLRTAHLGRISVPMLFLSGTRDTLAKVELMHAETRKLGGKAVLHRLEGADHGFHVLKRSGRTDEDITGEAADTVRSWTERLLASR
jgi:predicted alpha/beta-hydrolase family hydrolase